MWNRAQVILIAFALTLAVSRGAELSLKVIDKAPPEIVDASITKLLKLQALQLADGSTAAWEFWWVNEVPLKSKPATAESSLSALQQATLVGVVNVPKARRDYRDDEIAAGVYTMRFILQPQDGNHLGTAEFDFFVALVPVKSDTKPDGIADYKSLVKASSKVNPGDHPLILSVRPSKESEAPKLTDPAPEHKALRVKMPGKVSGGGDKADVQFELVYEGKGHK